MLSFLKNKKKTTAVAFRVFGIRAALIVFFVLNIESTFNIRGGGGDDFMHSYVAN